MGGFLPIKSDLKLLPIVDNLIRKNLITYMEDSSDELTYEYGIDLSDGEEYIECLNPKSECYAAFLYELVDFFTKRYDYSYQKEGNLTHRLSTWIISDIMKYGFDFDDTKYYYWYGNAGIPVEIGTYNAGDVFTLSITSVLSLI